MQSQEGMGMSQSPSNRVSGWNVMPKENRGADKGLNPLLIGSLGGTPMAAPSVRRQRLNPLLIGSLGGTEDTFTPAPR